MRRFGLLLLLLTLPALSWAQKVALDTTLGTIVIQLNAQAAPKTVANFLEYVKSGHYDNTVFHRVIEQLHDPGRRLYRRPQRKADASRRSRSKARMA